MDKKEIIRRLRNIADHAVYREGEGTFSLSLDDGIALCEASEMLEQLPSAQPEIIRCEDCKHRDPEDKKCDCGHGIRWQLPRDDYWFCADGERRNDA